MTEAAPKTSRRLTPKLEAGIAVVALAALTGGLALAGAQAVPQPETVQLQSTVGRVCPALAETPGKLFVVADGEGGIINGPLGAETSSHDATSFELDNVTAPYTLATDSSGGVVSAGLHIGGEAQQWWGACLPTSAQSQLLMQGARGTKLHLINPYTVEALINVSLIGPEGEVTADNLRDLRVEPGDVEIVDLEPIVNDLAPVSVRVQSSAGRVLAVASQLTGDGAEFISSSALSRELVLPGVPPRAQAASLMLANPATTRTRVKVEVLAASGRFVPDGGAEISVEAGRTARVDLTPALREEAASIIITADDPVAAGVVTRTEKDLAHIPAQPLRPRSGEGVLAVPIVNGGELVLSNPGTTEVEATIDWGEGMTRGVHRVPAGATIVVPTAEGATEVQVLTDGLLVGGLVLGNTNEAGVAVAPLLDFSALRASLPIRVEPRLGS